MDRSINISSNSKRIVNWWPWITAALIVLLLVGYLYNLTGWRIFDDEGEYLYQVWRMTQGEMPYRDFLTPQLPVYLYSGTLVMHLFGNSLFVMRLYTVLLAFASGVMLFFAGKRHKNVLAGWLAMVLFLLHSDVFKEMRIFRNEPIYILLVTAGVLLATWPKEGVQRRFLAAAGVCFGLGTMVKLFGLLPAGGIGLWLIWEMVRHKRPFPQFIRDGLALIGPVLLVLGLFFALFTWLSPNFFDLVVGHHLAQGSEQEAGSVLMRQLGLYAVYVRFYPVLVPVALVSGVIGVVRDDVRQRWVWQFVMVTAFLVLSRQFGQRHFMFLLPVMVLLAAWLIAEGINGRYRWWGRLLAVTAFIAITIPFLQANAYRAQWEDQVTQPILDLIDEHTNEDDVILADDIGLAYYSGRKTTYAGAALSHGAITSRQITAELLINEIAQDNVRMVIVDTSLLTGNHMVFLDDYPRFYRFLEHNFEYLGNHRRDYQELDVWVRDKSRAVDTNDYYTIAQRDGTQFGETLHLQGYTLAEESVQAGDKVAFTLYWTAEAPDEHYWSVFTHLISPDGSIVGQHDKVPYDGLYPTEQWQPGVVVDDRFEIMVPEDVAPGEYKIGIGMYDWLTGEQLPLFSPDGTPIPNNRHVIAQPIMIVP